MGFFSSLDAEKYDRKYSDRQLLARIIEYFKPHAGRLALVTILILLVSGAVSVQPIIVSRGIDYLQKGQITQVFPLLVGTVFIVGLIRWSANWMQRRMMVRVIATVVFTIAKNAFQASADHDLSFYDEFSSGKIQSRITTDTRDFGEMIVLTTDLVSQVIQALILGVVLIRIEWHLALLVFTIIPLVFFLAILYRSLARRVVQQGMRAIADVNATIKETVSGIAVAKNFRQEASIYEEFNQANSLSYKLNVRRGMTLAVVFPTLNIIGGGISAGLVYFGGLTVIQGIITAGSWYLFLLSLDYFLYPVMSMSSFMTQVQTGLAAAERVFALIDAEPAVMQVGNQSVHQLRGEIEFVHLDFHYKKGEEVLLDLNLHIQPGENLAIVGHTGAGKSSIAKLIARFYEYQSGKLLIDGKDIRILNLQEYRRQLGIVSQIPFLFSGSVVENICYARPETSVEEVMDFASRIGNGEWLETLPDGLKTEVGERGSRLSMGQRQLVSLMRVLVQKPAIFILDEATASIDPFTEWQIQQALKMILSSTTSILIAHRLSTVKSADRIIVMRNGEIIEEGNHPGLLAQGGHYAELYNTYFRHQSLAYIEQSRKIVSVNRFVSLDRKAE